MNFWHMQISPDDSKLANEWAKEALKESVIALDIDPSLDPTNGKSFDKWVDDDFNKCIQYHENRSKNAGPGVASSLWKFYSVMNPGDILLVRAGNDPIALVKVGKYFFEPHPKGKMTFRHRRKVEILDWYKKFKTRFPDFNLKPPSQGTLAILKDQNSGTYQSIVNWYDEIKKEKYMNEIYSFLENNKNLVLTGAPGTGKTYLANEVANEMIKTDMNKRPYDLLLEYVNSFKPDQNHRNQLRDIRNEFLNLFPLNTLNSLTLEDYCLGSGDRNNFCWWMENGLKDLGLFFPGPRGSYVYGIYYDKDNAEYKLHKAFNQNTTPIDALNKILELIVDAINSENGRKKTLNSKVIDNRFLLKILYTYLPDEFFPINSKSHMNNVINLFELDTPENATVLDKNKRIMKFYRDIVGDNDITPLEFMGILYENFNIPEGEIRISDKKINLEGETQFVQFHPSYDYTDFVEGLRPIKKDNEELGFELKDGIFKAFCKKAIKNPNKNYVIIIDEINRAEISKVFGELFFGIDPGYRGRKGKIKTQYANMQAKESEIPDLQEGYLYVPNNLYIIGTMNDIDRSVETFDFAIRRRFAWKEIAPDDRIEMLDEEIPEWKDKAVKRMNALNKSIINDIEGLNNAYQIGPAYFLKLKHYNNDENFTKLWENHLQPLLKEYLRGIPDADNKVEILKSAYDGNE